MGETWYQVEIKDESALSGPSLARLVQIVTDAVPVSVVGVIGAEGAGPGFRARFPEGKLVILNLKSFATSVADVVQFDWGDFLLTQTEGALSGVQPATPYEDVLSRTVATIRAVDDTYFYVYTRNKKAAQSVLQTYPGAAFYERDLSELDFPE